MNSYVRIPILLYHRIVSSSKYQNVCLGSEKIFSIDKDRFEEQMEYLHRQNYNSIFLDDLVNYITKGTSLPPKPIIITFDDGQRSQLETALPILKKYGLKATIFVTTDPTASVFKDTWHIDRPLTKQQIKELSKAGVSIQSHTVTHPILPELTDEEVLFEFKESKKILESIIDKPVQFLSIPLGFCNKRIKKLAKQAGYKAICTANVGTNGKNTDLFSLRRITIEGTFNLKEFKKNLTPFGICQRKIIVLFFKRIPPKIFGLKRWMKFRKWLFNTKFSYFLTLRRLKWLGLIVFLAIFLLVVVLFLK
ncbi:MAG: hypothetical protein DRP84_09370 [Spirochaetes bacterium]|nr:MAG: hypothetical protein DRP84_09370 [Spirochaetota bacterium]